MIAHQVWPNNIPDIVPDKYCPSRASLLRAPCDIRRRKREEQHVRRAKYRKEVVSEQCESAMMPRAAPQNDCADHDGETCQSEEKRARILIPALWVYGVSQTLRARR